METEDNNPAMYVEANGQRRYCMGLKATNLTAIPKMKTIRLLPTLKNHDGFWGQEGVLLANGMIVLERNS